MTITISPNTVGIWFMPLDDTSDFMGGLEKIEDGRYKLSCRIRYHDGKNGDPFSAKTTDKKVWKIGEVSGDERRAKLVMSMLIAPMESASGNRCDCVLMKDGDIDGFFETLGKKHWCHIKVEQLPPKKERH